MSYTDDDERRRRRRDDDDDDDRGRGRGRGRDDDYDDDDGPRRSVQIPNYLVQAILCTLFCCLPGGIVAIVYAAQVNGKIAAGDIRGARSASDSARTWCWVSFGVGLVVSIIYLIVNFAILGAMRKGL
jgi:hypothetical protein